MNANLAGLNLLQNQNSANEADAMTRDLSKNFVFTNSWGAPDGTGTLRPSTSTWQAAINTGLSTGRGGLGAIYTWAAGNGANSSGTAPIDSSDTDGQANYRGIIAVGAATNLGKKSSYSDPGSNLLVTAYGGEFCGATVYAISTTDMTGIKGLNAAGYNYEQNSPDFSPNDNYTKCMNGTSAASPQAAGVAALVLEANPNLTWRDVRLVLAKSARKNDATDSDWKLNGGGLWVNHKYGYGILNAASAVNIAKTWINVGPEKTATGANLTAVTIPDGKGSSTSPSYGTPAATSSITIASSGITAVEFVDVNVYSDHSGTGDLRIRLTSPKGTVSNLTIGGHPCYSSINTSSVVSCGSWPSAGFRFGVARLIDETADGTWMLTVDDGITGNTGSLTKWDIKIYGR
jgi:kexin